jgi:hypothetical protein
MAGLTRVFSALLAALLMAACAGAQAQDSQRIFAVGDLHGDYAAFVDIVQAAGLADANGNWTGGDAVLVQLGDIPDRGPDSRKIIEFLQKLEKAAPRDGGQLVLLVGNHEAMNVTGDLRYVSDGEYAAFVDRESEERRDQVFNANTASIVAFYREWFPNGSITAIKGTWEDSWPLGKAEHRLAWRPKGEIGKWVLSHPAIAKVGDTLFVHGGLSAEYAARPIAAINAEVRAALEQGETSEPTILTDELGPLWYRGNVQRGEADEGRPAIADELATVLASNGAERLVVAHTPNLEGVIADQEGRLLRADTGISSYYGGPRSFLVLQGATASAWEKVPGGEWDQRALPVPDGGYGR